MNLAATIWLYGGRAGSGCKGPNCGRPSGLVRNLNVFGAPPPMASRYTGGELVMDHYVVEPDGTAKKVSSHQTYFSSKNVLPVDKFLRQGGVTVTVTAGGPGIAFGRKDEETVDRVLQVAGHPEFREHGATVEYYNPDTSEQFTFNGSRVGELAREMRAWVQQKRAA